MAPGKAPKRGGDKSDKPKPYSHKSGSGTRPSSGADESQTPDVIQLNEDRLVEALQARIHVPIYGIGTLRRYLQDASCVQDIAYDAFMADYRKVAAARPSSEARAGLPDNIHGIPVIFHTNPEEQRREAVRLLRAVVNVDRDPDNRIELTLSEAILTLALTGWDVEAGAIRWASPNVIRWQLHHTFDHLRPTTSNQVDMDERLAQMVHFVGRDDWHSIRDFLATHNQRLVQAIIAWYKSGIPVVRPVGWNNCSRLYVGRRVTYDGQPRSPMPSDSDVMPMQVNEDAWAAELTTFRPAGSMPDDELAQASQDPHTASTKRVRGFCLTPEGNPPEVGGVMPSHFTIDYVQKGKYKANGFDWKDYFRPELPKSDDNDPDNPVFDEYAGKHIAHLGRWRRQQYSRIEQTKKKETPQEFSKEEKRYLFDLCERHLQKLMGENPGQTREEFKPLQFRSGATERLEKDFNDKFEGKKLGTATEPRRRRKGNALKVKCGRMKKFRIAFGFKKTTEGTNDDDASSLSEWEALPPTQPGQLIISRIVNIDADADNLLSRTRGEAQTSVDDAGNDEQVAARVQELLTAGLTDGRVSEDMRAVIRHLLRRLGMTVPDAGDGDIDAEEEPANSTDIAETTVPEPVNEASDIEELEFESDDFDDSD